MLWYWLGFEKKSRLIMAYWIHNSGWVALLLTKSRTLNDQIMFVKHYPNRSVDRLGWPYDTDRYMGANLQLLRGLLPRLRPVLALGPRLWQEGCFSLLRYNKKILIVSLANFSVALHLFILPENLSSPPFYEKGMQWMGEVRYGWWGIDFTTAL